MDKEKIAEQNRRKLAEHLERLKRGGGTRADQDSRGTGGGERPRSEEEARAAAQRVRADERARMEGRWEAWKRMHGERVHRINPDSVSGDPAAADYKALGVSRNATAEEVRRAFYRLAKSSHPDRGGDPEQFHALQTAYARIMKARQNLGAEP